MAKKAKKTGRPTKYKTEFATDEHTQGFIDQCEEKKEVVTLCGYAVYIDVSEETLNAWSKSKPAFSETIRKIKAVSKSQLFQGGLNKSLSSKIVKLGLSANHGMNEKTEHEHGVNKETATLLGLIDGSSKGQLPTSQEVEEAGE